LAKSSYSEGAATPYATQEAAGLIGNPKLFIRLIAIELCWLYRWRLPTGFDI